MQNIDIKLPVEDFASVLENGVTDAEFKDLLQRKIDAFTDATTQEIEKLIIKDDGFDLVPKNPGNAPCSACEG